MKHSEILLSQPAWILSLLKNLASWRFHPGDSGVNGDMVKIAMVSDSVEVVLFYDATTNALESALADSSQKPEPPASLRLFAQPGTPYVFEEVAQVLLESGFEYQCAPRGGSEFEVRFARGQEDHSGLTAALGSHRLHLAARKSAFGLVCTHAYSWAVFF